MTQKALITKIINPYTAEISVIRETACGGNCTSCESCMYQSELRVNAVNNIGAKVGDKVVVETDSNLIYKAIVLVYILPIIFMVVSFTIAAILHAGQGVCILCSFLGLLVGFVFIAISEKLKAFRKVEFSVVSVLSNIKEDI